MKLHLRLDNGEDPDPARSRCSDLIGNAEKAFARALDKLFPEGALPARAEISLAFPTLADIKEKNRTFRGIDEPTDVLSFPLWEEDGEFRPGSRLPVLPLGDILICPEYVRNAVSPSGPDAFREEMALMLAHGFLHLLAWDHDTEERQQRMEALQEEIRREILSPSAGDAEPGSEKEVRK